MFMADVLFLLELCVVKVLSACTGARSSFQDGGEGSLCNKKGRAECGGGAEGKVSGRAEVRRVTRAAVVVNR